MADFISALLMCRKIPRQKKIRALRGCDADVQGIVLTSLRDDTIGKQRLCPFDGLVRDGQAWNSGHKILAPFGRPFVAETDFFFDQRRKCEARSGGGRRAPTPVKRVDRESTPLNSNHRSISFF